MTWVKLDDGMPTHPKIVERSDAAFRAIVEMWCYAAQHKTNGRIGTKAAAKIAKPRVLNELLDAGLLTQNGTGLIIHNWLIRNISAEEHEARKEAAAERQKRWRETHRSDDGTFHE